MNWNFLYHFIVAPWDLRISCVWSINTKSMKHFISFTYNSSILSFLFDILSVFISTSQGGVPGRTREGAKISFDSCINVAQGNHSLTVKTYNFSRYSLYIHSGQSGRHHHGRGGPESRGPRRPSSACTTHSSATRGPAVGGVSRTKSQILTV